MADETGEITQYLQEIRAGDKDAESRLMEAVYPKLKRIAAHYLRQERAGHTLQATALVNEAYLQLLRQADISLHGRAHFFADAAQSMRRTLLDYARMRKACKRDAQLPKGELSDD